MKTNISLSGTIIIVMLIQMAYSIFFSTYMLSDNEKMQILKSSLVVGPFLFSLYFFLFQKLFSCKYLLLVIPLILIVGLISFYIIDYLVEAKDGNLHEYLIVYPFSFGAIGGFFNALALKIQGYKNKKALKGTQTSCDPEP